MSNNDLEARLNLSKGLIKPELLNEWKDYVRINTDIYSAAIVEASIKAMQALTEGKTPAEADEITKQMDLTGFMAGAMARTITYFHPRGEEFRQYWNSLFSDSKDIKGVINPAILYFKE